MMIFRAANGIHSNTGMCIPSTWLKRELSTEICAQNYAQVYSFAQLIPPPKAKIQDYAHSRLEKIYSEAEMNSKDSIDTSRVT